MIRQFLPSRYVGHGAAHGWVALLFALAVVLLACGGGTSTVQTGGSSGSSGSGSTATATSSGGSGTTPTSTATSGGTSPTATAGTGPTATPVPFTVSSASASASPANFNGNCSNTGTMTTNFTATINVPAHTNGGTVSYHWTRSDGSSGPTQTLHFNAGDTWHTASVSWTFGAVYGNGSTYWEAIVVTAPNSVSSNHGNATLTCQFHVLGASGSAYPSSYTCGSTSVVFSFIGYFSVSPSPGGTITYKWIRSDGASAPTQNVAVPADNDLVSVTTSWTLYSGVPNGTYWEELEAVSPSGVTSSKISFTVSC